MSARVLLPTALVLALAWGASGARAQSEECAASEELRAEYQELDRCERLYAPRDGERGLDELCAAHALGGAPDEDEDACAERATVYCRCRRCVADGGQGCEGATRPGGPRATANGPESMHEVVWQAGRAGAHWGSSSTVWWIQGLEVYTDSYATAFSHYGLVAFVFPERDPDRVTEVPHLYHTLSLLVQPTPVLFAGEGVLGRGGITIGVGYGYGDVDQGGSIDVRARYSIPTGEVAHRPYFRAVSTMFASNELAWLATDGSRGDAFDVQLEPRARIPCSEGDEGCRVDLSIALRAGGISTGNGSAPLSGLLLSGELRIGLLSRDVAVHGEIGISGTSVLPEEALLPLYGQLGLDLFPLSWVQADQSVEGQRSVDPLLLVLRPTFGLTGYLLADRLDWCIGMTVETRAWRVLGS